MAEPKIINWACGEHPFMLRIGEAEALDDLTRDGVADFRYRCRDGIERGSLGFSPVRTAVLRPQGPGSSHSDAAHFGRAAGAAGSVPASGRFFRR